MRIFIAIDLSELKEYFLETQKKIDTNLGKFSLTKTYHITLKFWGDYTNQQVEQLKEKLEKIKFKKFELILSSLGYFGSKKHPRIIWQSAKSKELIQLQEEIEAIVDEKRELKFHPHVTLARIKQTDKGRELVESIPKIIPEQKTLSITKFILYKSTLTSEGPIYEVLEEFTAQ